MPVNGHVSFEKDQSTPFLSIAPGTKVKVVMVLEMESVINDMLGHSAQLNIVDAGLPEVMEVADSSALFSGDILNLSGVSSV